MVIITLLTSIDKRLKLSVGVATGRLRVTPEVSDGACVVTKFSRKNCVIAHATGLAPSKISGVFLLATDRTPPVSKSLHGLRGTEHRRVDNPRYSRPAFQRGTGEHVRYSGETERTWKESLAPATLDEASSAPLRARVNPVLHPWGCYALLIFH